MCASAMTTRLGYSVKSPTRASKKFIRSSLTSLVNTYLLTHSRCKTSRDRRMHRYMAVLRRTSLSVPLYHRQDD